MLPQLLSALILTVEFQATSINSFVQIKPDSAHLSAYLAEHTNVNFGKFHSVCILLTKENERIVPVMCPLHFVWNTSKKECGLLISDIETFIMKVFDDFSCSSKYTETLNEISDIIKGEEGIFLSKRWLSLLPAMENKLKN